MKGLNLFLAACFVVPVLNGAMADTTKNTNRTPSARGQQNTTSTVRNNGSVKQRATTTQNTTARTTTTTKNIVQRTSSDKARSAMPTRNTSITARTAKKTPVSARTAKQSTIKSTMRSGLSRAATTPTRESVMQRDFGKCKTVFFECMDEFCANKDAQLKRCACSSRNNEFQSTQKSLDNVEDKLLDFSQHLLKVNMDPADAAVINQETEGEKAYNETKDKTASRKTLDEIAKKLNTSFDSAENNMSALSWSLNVDAAFDSVDSLSGTATTAKSGVALRNAALPICREMAAEVCSDDDISLVENSYNMAIEQDCNTVKKAYETQTQAAKNKVLESSALLDMTRLNKHQEDNSDDILTCKSKMLDMLSNTNVCGTDLTKCLDISGRYINPTTGEAFLSPELVNLATLIVRPTNSDTWSRTPANSSFVSYLNSKKKYMESATKNCQDIADDVWNEFIDDALAQIKLAQNAKLEEVRQSCTTLLAECLESANESLADFDSRALSTFGVMTDKTVNALCENIKLSCAAIMEYTPDDSAVLTADADWAQGTTDIAASESYTKIINTCREIGRDCIINSCKSITGNFGLCESIHGSVNRHSILTRSACWSQVESCVNQASDETVKNIRHILPNYGTNPQSLYEYTYDIINTYGSTDQNRKVFDICRETGNAPCSRANQSDPFYDDPDNVDCYRCRIAEQIWGNCKLQPDNIATNAILIPTDPNTTTLLSWFAKNTHTQDEDDSCAVSICPAGQIEITIDTTVKCMSPSSVMQCPAYSMNISCEDKILTPALNTYNCCPPTSKKDDWGHCCMGGVTSTIKQHLSGMLQNDPHLTTTSAVCTPGVNTTIMTLLAKYTDSTAGTTTYIFCADDATVNGTPNQITCNSSYVSLECDGTNCYYSKPTSNSTYNPSFDHNFDVNYYINVDATQSNQTLYCDAYNNSNNANVCKMDVNTAKYWGAGSCPSTPDLTNKHWLIKF